MERSIVRILENCNQLNHLKQTHLQILIHGLAQTNRITSNLIRASTSSNYALRLFRNCPSPDVTTHNFLIQSLNAHNSPSEAFRTYKSMWASAVSPNSYSFTIVFRTSELLGSFQCGLQIHDHVVKCGFGSHLFVANTLLDFYGKVGGDVYLARKVFDEMLLRDVCSWNSMVCAYMACGERELAMGLFESMPKRNVVSWNVVLRGQLKAGDVDAAWAVFDRMVVRNQCSWNSMITGYAELGNMKLAREVFEAMVDKTVVSWTAMITGYAKIGDLESMVKLFEEMPVRNVVTWNAMIAGYNKNSQFNHALQVFHWMLVDGKFVPDETTMISVVSACAQLGALEHGNWIYAYIKKKKIHIRITLGNALIDMFAKCGDVKTSYSIFLSMMERCIITWTTMISGLGLNGKCREAIALFEDMCKEKIEPDDTVFIATITACTHGGLVKEGHQIFNRMLGEFGIKPKAKHYGCIVDLLSRAGKLNEAIQFIESMPIVPESITWASLLSSCKAHGNKELVDYVSRKIADRDPLNSGYRVLISNSSASVGKWQDVVRARHEMSSLGIEKVPGCSSIQIGDKIHEFIVKDARHRMRNEIYDTLNGLTGLLRQVIDESSIAQCFTH